MIPDQVATADGRRLDIHSIGRGPGVVVVHGSAVVASDYRRLADAVAGDATVHLYDRRGRGARGPVDASHGVASDIDDLRAVLAHTGARHVLAHSYGGLVALQGAGVLPVDPIPVDRLAVYDAAVSIDGSFPSAYVEPFARAAGDFPLAMAVLCRGLGTAGPASRLPLPVLRAAAYAFAATPPGRAWRAMVPSAVVEAREVLAHDRSACAYAGITADVLLVTGARSPAYFAPASAALARALPRARHLVVPGAGHNAVNLADAAVIRPIVEFLLGD